MCVCVYVCMYVCMYVCIMCIDVELLVHAGLVHKLEVSVCLCVCVYVCMYECIYVCMYGIAADWL